MIYNAFITKACKAGRGNSKKIFRNKQFRQALTRNSKYFYSKYTPFITKCVTDKSQKTTSFSCYHLHPYFRKCSMQQRYFSICKDFPKGNEDEILY